MRENEQEQRVVKGQASSACRGVPGSAQSPGSLPSPCRVPASAARSQTLSAFSVLKAIPQKCCLCVCGVSHSSEEQH